ncbi:MAG TPA: AMP-binding protein, partial [Candidatus Binatia bacterium]|nr:AMP-binding protein [Candidatus Binatia bacterium]
MNKPWLKHYGPGVPHQVEFPQLTLPDLLPAAVRRYPERTALVLAMAAAGRLFNYSLSYAKLYQQVTHFAASLQGLGVQKGDRVAIYLPNCPQFVIAFLAAMQIGAIAVPFNPLYSAREAEYQLKDCGARVAVVLDRFFPIVQQVQHKTELRNIVITSIKEYFSPVLWTLYTLTLERKLPRFKAGPEDFRFQALLRAGMPRPVAVEA